MNDKRSSLDEFALIKRYFDRSRAGVETAHDKSGVRLGIGDDCAIVQLSSTEELVISTDTLVGGVHFPEHSDPALIAQRALRVNLSDLAAMGGQARWLLLALTLPEADEPWLASFSEGLHEVAALYNCALIGGDTTRGPLSITITVGGSVPSGKALVRHDARIGDSVYVTGSLGDAAAGLALIQGRIERGRVSTEHQKYLLERFWRPTPRLAEGLLLRNYASAAIDISDGLVADLGRIVERSGVGGELQLTTLPLSPALVEAASEGEASVWAASAGDDYELCFTVPAQNIAALEADIAAGLLQAQAIGRIVPGSGVLCRDAHGQSKDFSDQGYSHF